MKTIKCAKLWNLPVVRRKAICVLLGIGFGFLCAWYAQLATPEFREMTHFWWTAEMWEIVFNRFLLGIVVFLSGGFVWDPVWGIRLFPWMRGALVGTVVSLDASIGALAGVAGWDGFLAMLAAGILFGIIIDILATQFGGEGEKLLDACCTQERKNWFWQK